MDNISDYEPSDALPLRGQERLPCHDCGREGHLQRFCPLRAENLRYWRLRTRTRPRFAGGHARHIPTMPSYAADMSFYSRLQPELSSQQARSDQRRTPPRFQRHRTRSTSGPLDDPMDLSVVQHSNALVRVTSLSF